MRFLIATLLLSSSSFALSKKLVICETPMKDKILKISEDTIKVANTAKKERRDIASTISIRTFDHGKGFTKVFNYKNQEAKVHIENMKDLNEADDYFSLTSKQGHQMTFPIHCSLK